MRVPYVDKRITFPTPEHPLMMRGGYFCIFSLGLSIYMLICRYMKFLNKSWRRNVCFVSEFIDLSHSISK